MKITSDLNNILIRAYEEAKKISSEYITPEHLLYAATFDEKVAHAIEKCGGNIDNLQYNLKIYMKTYVSTTSGEPQESIEFQRVILTADEQVKYSGKEVIDTDHILAAIFTLEDSYALYYLLQEGVNKRDLLFNLCHEEKEEETGIDSSEDEEKESLEESDSKYDEKTRRKKEEAFLNKYTTDLIEKVRENS
ncbi:MAG: Clp protease N-terminal domain-containing protein, partial [Clostridium sp.]